MDSRITEPSLRNKVSKLEKPKNSMIRLLKEMDEAGFSTPIYSNSAKAGKAIPALKTNDPE